ncbi:TadE family type IV pilus minor pilin [Streptomyces sp. TRM 70351]|uniref:TadE family type IV pilus minor pilin n=1 Tax=Streptomyces sp. TRM 70351 TaxID=3116552 RepID=UPI002E7B62C9|nr:TadE family type IV pilus minor pilin [Streptomyces sp. TRM 70351]MEE1930277.1 TadE family type IV pilus minor pilin [Streptomyces sp. TRM 70351]
MRASERARDDRGQATAETAAVVPCLVLLATMLIWGLLAAVAQIQCVDAARTGARAAARAEPEGRAVAAARAAAPSGARVELVRDGDLVRVRVSARSAGPGPLTAAVDWEAVAHVETG